MTTIAYKAGVLASDSRLTYDNDVCTDKCKKIWRLRDGSLYAFAGDNEPGLLLLEAMQAGVKVIKLPDNVDITAVRILPKGTIFMNEGAIWCRWPERFIAIGTGGKHARAAMIAGATATEAVKIAIGSDVHSGGRVQTLRLRR